MLKYLISKRNIVRNSNKRSNSKDTFAVIFACATAIFLNLWIYRESIPQIFHHSIQLGGDGSLTGFYLSLVEHSSYWSFLSQHIVSSYYGWPGNLDFTYYPIGQTLDLLLLKLTVTCVGPINPATVIHVVSILKVVPITIAAYVFARVIGLRYFLASIVGICYGVSNFNLVRSEGHFFLSLTWSIPLGLAAIFIGYRGYLEKVRVISRNTRTFDRQKIIILALLSSFSSYYFSIFILLAYIFIFLTTCSKEILHSRRNYFSFRRLSNWTSLIRNRNGLIIGFAITLFGFCFQTLPILIRRLDTPVLANVSDRSWTEPIVYGGTLDSYFFDILNLVSRALHHPEIAAFLQTRTSWEATQTGSTAGLLAYALLCAAIFFMASFLITGINDSRRMSYFKDKNLAFLLGLFVLFLSLYLVSPLNYLISRFLPEIRAWGRLSTVLTLLSITLACYLVSKVEKKIYAYSLLIFVVVLPTLADSKLFHDSRPTATYLNQQALKERQQLSITWKSLKKNFTRNCSLVNLPVYHFPEFDNPVDNNGDYAQLPLVSFDENYFHWSYPAIKDTTQSRNFQNLASEQPNFNRAALSYQIATSRSLNSCGVVIDRTLLVPSESKEFDRLEEISQKCFIDLGGEKFSGRSRFYAISFSARICSSNIFPISNSSILVPPNPNFLWKIDQPFSIKYFGGYEMFSPASEINFRIASLNSNFSKKATIRVHLVSRVRSFGNRIIQACISGPSLKFQICGENTSTSFDEILLQVPKSALIGKYQKFKAKLIWSNTSNISAWGISVN